MKSIEIAEKMLEINQGNLSLLYPTIYDKLVFMEKLIKPLGGSIQSRQIVALVIIQWKFDEE